MPNSIPIWEREAARTISIMNGEPERVRKPKAPKSIESIGEKAAKDGIKEIKKGTTPKDKPKAKAKAKTKAGPKAGPAPEADGMKRGSSWKPPTETPRPTPTAAPKGPGLLSKWGGRGLTGLRIAGGPVSAAIQAGILPGDLGNSDLESPEEGASNWVNENPEEAISATDKINSLVNRSIQGAKEKWTPPPVQEQAPEVAPPATPEAPPQAPAPDPEQQKQIEIQRQTVETGALKGLETGQVSRPGLAEAIVDADAQRAGEQLTPEQSKQAVQQELVSMKSMDNTELSKYVSYALIAGGVLASFLDKSGKSADMFHESFNRQLDRNAEEKERAAAAEQAALKHALEERRVAATEADVGSKVEDRVETRELTKTKNEGLLEKWLREGALGYAKLGNEQARTGIMYDTLSMNIQDKNIKNSLASRGLDQYDRRLGQWDRQLEQNAKTGGAGGSGTGVPLSYEDNTKLTSDVLSAKGINVSTEVKQAVAARLPTIQKLTPDLSATQMVELAMDELQGEISNKDESWFGGRFGKDMKYSFDKLQ